MRYELIKPQSNMPISRSKKIIFKIKLPRKITNYVFSRLNKIFYLLGVSFQTINSFWIL